MPYEEIKIVCVKELLMVLLKKGFARPSYAKFWMTFIESPTFWSSFFQNEIPCLLDTNTRLQLLFLDVNEAGKKIGQREKKLSYKTLQFSTACLLVSLVGDEKRKTRIGIDRV